jgi:DNA-binding NarL/FixJ family response regulator
MISIMLVDDHEVVLRGLRDLFESEADLRIIGHESDPLKAVREIRRLVPDVLVLDLIMPGLNGLVLTSQVTKQCPGTRIVVLSVHTDIAYVCEALRSGANAYVTKSAAGEDLVRAVREAAAGRRYLSPHFSEREIDEHLSRSQESSLDSYAMLTDRERQVLLMSGAGDTSSQIAEKLNISPRTVEKHRANVYRKLGISSQTELVRYVLRRGIASID